VAVLCIAECYKVFYVVFLDSKGKNEKVSSSLQLASFLLPFEMFPIKS